MNNDLKVYTREVISEEPLPASVGEFNFAQTSSSSNREDVTRAKTPEQEFPAPIFSTELLSQALNTKARKILLPLEFTRFGALQIGEYSNGISGDVRISPNGVVARNISGENTFTLDGDTGDATFKGTVRASTFESSNILTGLIDVGNSGNSSYVRIDGANNRIIIHDGSNPRILIGNI